MAASAGIQVPRSSLARVRILARRDLRDTLRDWRIVTPIVVLTLAFPWLMNWTAQLAIDFVQRREAAIIGERLTTSACCCSLPSWRWSPWACWPSCC